MKMKGMQPVVAEDDVEEVRERGQSAQEKKSTKKGYRFGSALMQLAVMTCVAGCPVVSAPHRGLEKSLR